MSKAGAILATLVAYKLALVAIGLWASRRTHDAGDFLLGGRRLGGLVAAVSASASSSSAWTLLGVSGAAYLWGLSAAWLFPATVGGFLLNWLWVAPRLLARSHDEGSVTLTEVLAGAPGAPLRRPLARLASAILLFSFIFYIAAQFQAAGNAFASTFGLAMETSILIGAAIVLFYTLLGGFWAVSVTDTLQGLLMAATAVVLPLATLAAVGGPGGLLAGLAASGDAATLSPTGGRVPWLAAAFVAGTLGIGLGYPGQPHVVNRFMALADRGALRRARAIAIGWAVVVYAGMLTLGWCGRVLFAELAHREEVFFAAANELFPPVVAGVMIAAILSAIMSTADSQLLVAGSAVADDWHLERHRPSDRLTLSRWVVFVLTALAVALALFAPQAIFSRVLFAWHAVGSAFGPILLVELAGRRVAPAGKLAAMAVGCGLTVALHLVPDTPGDALERLLPFALALAAALATSRRQGKPG